MAEKIIPTIKAVTASKGVFDFIKWIFRKIADGEHDEVDKKIKVMIEILKKIIEIMDLVAQLD